MDLEYEEYCFDNAWFYDYKGHEHTNFNISIPREWKYSTTREWCYLDFSGSKLPSQGWKIHVSATLNNAQKILDTVSAYCFQERLAFKFVPTLEELMLKNGKTANRAAAG
jgi:hypothetical protein